MYGYVYKTTNILTNKIYIGQKKSTEFLYEKYLGSGVCLKNAVKKYGKENFKVELICECSSKEELDAKEIYYIDYYKSRDNSIGYNIATGGAFGDSGYHKGMCGKHQSEKQKLAASKANSYVRNEEIRKNFSDARKKSWQNSEYREKQLAVRKHWFAPNKGIPCSEEQKQKISKTVSATLKAKWNSLSAEERQKVGNNISKGKKGKIAITDGNRTYFITPTDWVLYENKGFYKMSYQAYIKKFGMKTA